MFEKQKVQLAKRTESDSFRKLKSTQELVDFSSNDYLGLSEMINLQGNQESVGSTGSRLLQGNYPLIEKLEKELANFHRAEQALVYNSGYVANVGLFSALPQKGDTILYDEFIHASVKDGVRLSFAKSFSFKHNSLEDLEKKLQNSTGDVYVAVESVYSMDGDCAPLKELVKMSKTHRFALIVDEAHAVGVYGEHGEGLAVENRIEQEIAIRVVTFGKAIGCHGAAVLSSPMVKDYLINFSRAFIYSTALPPLTVKSIQEAYRIMKKEKELKALKFNISYFVKGAAEQKVKGLIPSTSAIQCIVIPGNSEAKRTSVFLQEQGFDVRAILSPTVPQGKERIRICLHAFNTSVEIDRLLSFL